MDKKEQLQLVEVSYNENAGNRAILTFLDEDEGTVYEVNFTRDDYDEVANKWVESAEKSAKVDDQIKQVFDTTFDKLNSRAGNAYDVYVYDNFSSMFEFNVPEKFAVDEQGQIYQAEIKEIVQNNNMNKIEIRYEIDGKLYQSNMAYSKRVEAGGVVKFYKDPAKETRQLENFTKKFHVPFADKDSLIGKTVMVEVKAFNGNTYGDIKAMPKPKK